MGLVPLGGKGSDGRLNFCTKFLLEIVLLDFKFEEAACKAWCYFELSVLQREN